MYGRRRCEALYKHCVVNSQRRLSNVAYRRIGQWPASHKKLWKAILQFVTKRDIQLFATTHNIDCLQGLMATLAEDIKLRPLANVYDIARTARNGFRAYKYSYNGLKESFARNLEIRE